MGLDLTSLQKGVEYLAQALAVAADSEFMVKLTEEQANTVRAGVI